MKTIALDIRFRVASGASISIQNLASCLVRQVMPGIRFVTVRYPDQDLPPELDELDAVVVPKMRAPLELIWNEIRLPGLLARKGVDLYHGMKQCAPLRLRCPSVHTVDAIKRGSNDDLPIPLAPKIYNGWHVCNIYKHSDHLFPVAHHVGEFLTRNLGINPDRITVVHNGVNSTFLESTRPASASVENPLGIDAPFMVCIGSVIPLKNQLAVVSALSKIAGRVPHHLAILGREDPEYAQQIREAAEAGGITDRVHWVGFVDSDGLKCHMHAAKAMIHVSRTEGFCLATGEAMASGLPLVLTDRGGLREQCEDAALYIDDPDDHDALADQMLRLLTDPDLRDTMRQRGLKRAASLSWPEAARKTLAVYERLLKVA